MEKSNEKKEEEEKKNDSKFLTSTSKQGIWQIEGLEFSSQFESGNLTKVEKISPTHFNLWIGYDYFNEEKNIISKAGWFYFSVQIKEKFMKLTFTIKNITLTQLKDVLKEGFYPHYRKEGLINWERCTDPCSYVFEANKLIEITFSHLFAEKNSKYYFAFSIPWTNTYNNKFLKKYEELALSQKNLYFNQEILINSIEKRNIDLLTISSKKGKISDK